MSKRATPEVQAARRRTHELEDAIRLAKQKVSGAVLTAHFAAEREPEAVAAARLAARDAVEAVAWIENELHDARAAERRAWDAAPGEPFDFEGHARDAQEFYAWRMSRWA